MELSGILFFISDVPHRSQQLNGKSYSRVYIATVKLSTASHCNFDAVNEKYTAIIGRKKRLGCRGKLCKLLLSNQFHNIIFYNQVPETMPKDLTRNEMQEFHVTWYRGCVAISKNDTKYSYGKLKAQCFRGECFYLSFNSLEVS